MLEEARLDDLLPAIASIAAQEVHLTRQLYAAMKSDTDRRDDIIRWLHTLRSMRRDLELEFVGTDDTKEERERTPIGEAGCDLKHSFMNYCYMYELVEKDARQFYEAKTDEERNKALSLIEKHINNMELFRLRIFELRNILREG